MNEPKRSPVLDAATALRDLLINEPVVVEADPSGVRLTRFGCPLPNEGGFTNHPDARINLAMPFGITAPSRHRRGR